MGVSCDFNRIWDGVDAFLDSIDMKAEVEALAAARGYYTRDPQPDPELPPNPLVFHAAPDPLYTGSEYSPIWVKTYGKGVLDVMEDELPQKRVDILDWQHQSARRSSDNYVQEWLLQCLIAIGVLGASRADAERRCMDATSVLVNKWTGDGSQMGMNPATTGVHASWLTGGGWRFSQRDDGFMCVSQLLLTIEVRVEQTTD